MDEYGSSEDEDSQSSPHDPSSSEATEVLDQPHEVVEDLTEEQDASPPLAETEVSAKLDNAAPAIKPFNFQREMLDISLKENIIVCLETGSGKTHIAVMRILSELEQMSPSQLVWVLCPTVALCAQQYDYINKYIPSVQTKFLSRPEDVDRWTEQKFWDAVLLNVKIVVSTYQILLDAVSHEFVKMDSLALIVFDESHNCIGKHPGAKIMTMFYLPQKSAGFEVPAILGLSASPVMRSSDTSLNKIEETLDSQVRVPKLHRAELQARVKRPVLIPISYQGPPTSDSTVDYAATIENLRQAYRGMKIAEDPYVQLKRDDTEKSKRKLDKILLNHKTYSHEQMKRFLAMAVTILRGLGPAMCDCYIAEVISGVLRRAKSDDSLFGIWDDVSDAERQYLASILGQVKVSSDSKLSSTQTTPKALSVKPAISEKAARLIDFLAQEPWTITAIIFANERALVAMLGYLLSTPPATSSRYKTGTMVGTSSSVYQTRNISDLIDVEAQKDVLSSFKLGKINLLAATSVLEEGIDVRACNAVMCYSKPANLKSFVQRRGRARASDSKLVLLTDSQEKLADWQGLEHEMQQIYENETRELENAVKIEDKEDHDQRQFRVESTGAISHLDNALAHLYHFTSTLGSTSRYVDLRPDFICSEDNGFIKAKVVLPILLTESLRTTESQKV